MNIDDEFDGLLVDYPDQGCYYYNNMFRFPEEDLIRQQSGAQGGTGAQGMMNQNTPSGTIGMTPVMSSTAYTQGFLRTLIGKRVRVSFLIGTDMLVDRVGTLLEVGTTYIILNQLESNTKVLADLYAIKFVDIYNA